MSTHKKLGYFDEKFDIKKPGETKFRYIIFSSPRTGSNYICSRLCNLKHAYGIPMEYFHPDALEAFGKRFISTQSPSRKPFQWKLPDYMQHIERARTTADGWFGIKVLPRQLLPAVGNNFNGVVKFLTRFDRIVFMTRRDKLAQAVSGAIAFKTDAWFNFSDEPKLGEADIPSLFPLIAKLIFKFIEEENMILSAARHLTGKPCIHTIYEDTQSDLDSTYQAITEFLGIKNAATLPEEVIVQNTRKPSGVFAGRVRKEFLDFICGNPVRT